MKINRLTGIQRIMRGGIALAGCCLALAGAATIAHAAPTDYAIEWNVIASGGGTSSGGKYVLEATIGQPLTGGAANCTFVLASGYWTPEPVFDAPIGDLNGDGVVNGADLGLLLAMWGECDSCVGDLNCDGVVDGADLGLLLASWGQ